MATEWDEYRALHSALRRQAQDDVDVAVRVGVLLLLDFKHHQVRDKLRLKPAEMDRALAFLERVAPDVGHG